MARFHSFCCVVTGAAAMFLCSAHSLADEDVNIETLQMENATLGQPIQILKDRFPIVVPKNASMEDVHRALLWALNWGSWVVQDSHDAQITAIRHEKDYSASVKIDYGATGGTISYVDSSKLSYTVDDDQGLRYIHHRYNLWVEQIAADVALNMAPLDKTRTLKLPPGTSPEQLKSAALWAMEWRTWTVVDNKPGAIDALIKLREDFPGRIEFDYDNQGATIRSVDCSKLPDNLEFDGMWHAAKDGRERIRHYNQEAVERLAQDIEARVSRQTAAPAGSSG